MFTRANSFRQSPSLLSLSCNLFIHFSHQSSWAHKRNKEFSMVFVSQSECIFNIFSISSMKLCLFSFSNIINIKLFATDFSLFCAVSFKYQRPEGHAVPFGQCLFTLGCWQGKYWLQTFIQDPTRPSPVFTCRLISHVDRAGTHGVLSLVATLIFATDPLQIWPIQSRGDRFFLVFLFKSGKLCCLFLKTQAGCVLSYSLQGCQRRLTWHFELRRSVPTV